MQKIGKSRLSKASPVIKKRKRNRAVFFVVLILISLAIVNGIFKFVKFNDYVTKPIDGTEKRSSSSSWKGDRIITVAVDSDPVVLVVFDPSTRKVGTISMPRDTYSVVPADLGLYPVYSVRELGELKGVYSGELFENTLSNFINAPVERYLFFPKDKVVLGTEKGQIISSVQKAFSIENLIKAPFRVNKKEMVSNLSWSESLKLWWFARGIRSDRFEYYDLSKNGVISPIVLADGSTAYGADDVGVADFTRKVFTEEKILSEKLKIEILNGTDSPGRGNKIANILDNIGCDVVRVGNYTGEGLEKTKIVIGRDSRDTLTIRRLEEILDSKAEAGDFEARDVDITIILGQDILKRF